MALNNGPDPNSDSSQKPFAFAYILIPIIGFGLVAALVTCYRYRRGQRLARILGDPAYERELEAGMQRRRRTQVDRGPNGVVIITTTAGEGGGGEGGRIGGGRRSRRLGLGAGVGSREEGLNELGEAPPAYTPNRPKPSAAEGVENVELTTYSQATADAGTSTSPPGYDDEQHPATGTGTGTGARGTSENTGTNRASTENTTTNTTTPTITEPAPPPRAVLPPT
ncbi:hypothetical protein F5Y19DRAFT_316050 [Xylariaceae sp. FL1651]|nr:hypothetical protein F5Y19DRAFT_316050 [Xylariaceae sp. FL1651]